MYTRFTVWCSEVSRPKKHLPLLQSHHTPCKEDKRGREINYLCWLAGQMH